MDATDFQDLTNEETETVWGGMSSLACAGYGGLGMFAFATGNVFGVAACLLGAYAGGCFD